MTPRRSQRGNALVEMTLVGIPLMFVLISTFEIARGMWLYQTLAYAAGEGVRYARVHGKNCGTVAFITNTCLTSRQQIALEIRKAGIGLDLAQTTLTFQAGNSTTTCLLNGCPADVWPPSGADGIGTPLRIDIVTPFYSALAMFWPGATPVSFTRALLSAGASDRVQF